MEPWLQGGPFLEVSFILENNSPRDKFIKDFFKKLEKVPNKFQVMADDLDKEIDSFSEGYPYDETDPNTAQMHSIKIPMMIDVSGERKSMLYFEEISDKTIQVNFCFVRDSYSNEDNNDLVEFIKFLSSLYRTIGFSIGSVCIENDSLLFFDCNKTWPNEYYKLDNIDAGEIMKNIDNLDVVACLFDSEFFKIKNVPADSEMVGEKGILIKK